MGSEAVLDAATLARAGRSLPERFDVRVPAAGLTPTFPVDVSPAGDVVASCREVYRLLPGRRLTARVALGGVPAVMKLFIGPGARRYCDREARGSAYLTAAGVATPALLCTLGGPGDPARALLFEYLSDAVPICPEEDAALAAVAAELGRLHQAGYRHGDLHLDNFLRRSRGDVVVLDGDAVRRAPLGRPLSRRRSLHDLGVLGAQRPPLADDRLAYVVEAYAGARGWDTGAALAADALVEVRRQRRARVRRYLGKVQRECSEFCRRNGAGRRVVAVRDAWDEDLAAFAADPESVFGDAQVLKDGNSATVVRARLGGRVRVVKRYNVKSAWHAVRRSLRAVPRYRLAWLNGQRLFFLGIPTARPLALVERHRGPLRGVAYLVMEDLGDCNLADEIAQQGLSERRLAEVTALFRAVEVAGLVHGDTKISNFLVTGEGVALVDLDAMGEGNDRARRADVRRFLANFDDDPEVRRRLADALPAPA